ncbi:hypothetical protein [Micromonospora foliorum]|nr:hypothetical protein [Micromonospora foliorum]MCG5435228.1 hypothetical protein [Micromonospora foliorum]
MQKFDTPTPISATLDIPAGRIQFIAAERADTAATSVIRRWSTRWCAAVT